MKYSTTIKINNIGYDDILRDIITGKITLKEWEEVEHLLTREQKIELQNEIWERAVLRLLDKEDIEVMDYMNEMEKHVYFHETDDLPF